MRWGYIERRSVFFWYEHIEHHLSSMSHLALFDPFFSASKSSHLYLTRERDEI